MVRVLGKGSEATVRAAVALDWGTAVAVKCFERPALPADPGTGGRKLDAALRERETQHAALRDRFRAVAAITHPSVCRMFEFFSTPEKIYMVLELGEGDLQVFAKSRGGTLPDTTVHTVMERVFSALEHLHSHGIVHRDIKAPNVLLRSFHDPSSLFLADFCGAHVRPSDKRGMTTMIGTPFYLPPELVRGEPYGERVDCYSAGILAYELLFGATPFEDCGDFVELYRRIDGGSFSFPARPAPPPFFEHFVRGLLVNDPAGRMSAHAALLHPFLAPPPWEEDDSTGTLVVYDESTGELKCAPRGGWPDG
ncbi:kinase-like domain-containing protein [Hyaloraphidium curvatum]|nr:kinase-like domain-containing protein [Hyaloraphidium curvatum]